MLLLFYIVLFVTMPALYLPLSLDSPVIWSEIRVWQIFLFYGPSIFILFFIFGFIFGKHASIFYPLGFSRLNLWYSVPIKVYFSGVKIPRGTEGKSCEYVNVQWHIFTYFNSILLPGFFGIKGNFSKFNIFKAFFVLFYCSMTAVTLSKGYFSYY